MKKIFTLLSASLFTLAAIAGGDRPGSMLTVQSQGRGNLKVIVDGRYFEPYDNTMRLRGINAGDHTVKIIQEKAYGFFNPFGNRSTTVYNGVICIKPGTQVTLMIDRYGRTTKSESYFDGYYSWGDRGRDHDNRGFDRDDNGRYQNGYDSRHDYDFDSNDRYGNDNRGNGRNDNQGDNREGNRTGGGQNGGNNGGYNGGNNGVGYGTRMGDAMSDRDFSQLLSSLDKEWFENNKIKSVTQVISGNYFTAAQVKQLVLEFSFESNKLDVAKQTYSHTIDKSNYYMIYDAFTFSSSKDELDRYIRTSR